MVRRSRSAWLQDPALECAYLVDGGSESRQSAAGSKKEGRCYSRCAIRLRRVAQRFFACVHILRSWVKKENRVRRDGEFLANPIS